MANNWTSFQIDLGPVNPIASGVLALTDAVSTALAIQKSVVSVVANLALDLLSVEALLIKTALKVIEDVIDAYVITDAKLHALVIPPRRQIPYKLPSEYIMPQEENSWAINDLISAEDKAQFQKSLRVIAEHDQGNPGFARTFVESLYDEHDPNKPEYDENCAIFSVAIVAGAQSMLGLYDLLRALEGIFGATLRGNPLIPATVTRTPQNLKGQPISAPGSNRIGVRLSWTNADALQTLVEYDGARVIIQEIAIIRSLDDQVMVADNWGSVFGAEQPTPLTEDESEKQNVTASGSSKLIRIFKYDGIRNAYVDDDEDLAKGRDYYYVLAYRYAIAEPSEGSPHNLDITHQEYHHISNVVKVRVRDDKVPTTHLSVQPNWVTHTSFLDMIPDLKFFMKLVENYIKALRSRISGAASALETYIKYLQAEVDRYSAFAEDINNRIAKLASLLQVPATGIYMTVIAEDSGGNEALMHQLIKRLTDETDATAPPFFRNGLVGGIVLVAGAPNPAALTSTKTLISLLLGLESNATTSFEDAINTIDATLNQLENTTFGADLKPGTAPAETVAYDTFSDEMEGVVATDGEANVPYDP